MSIGMKILRSKPFVCNIFQEFRPGIARISEVPKGVCCRALPDALIAMDEQRLETPVQVGHLGVEAQHGDDATQVQVVAVVFQSELVAALHFGDELAPALDQTSAPGADDMDGITVLAEISGHFRV